MLIAENMTALFVFALWAVAFALGYALRGLYAGTFKEWTRTAAYRNTTTMTRNRRASNGEH